MLELENEMDIIRLKKYSNSMSKFDPKLHTVNLCALAGLHINTQNGKSRQVYVPRQVYVWAGGCSYTNAGKTRIKKESGVYSVDMANFKKASFLSILNTLKLLKLPCNVIITTHDQFITNAYQGEIINKWKVNGWRSAANNLIPCRDEMEILESYMDYHNIVFKAFDEEALLSIEVKKALADKVKELKDH